MSGIVEKIVLFSALLVALGFLLKFAFPVVKQALKDRSDDFTKKRLELQNQLRIARKSYQDANFQYMRSVEQKLRWMDEAKKMVQVKMDELESKHAVDLGNLHLQYDLKRKMLLRQSRELYLGEMIHTIAGYLAKDADKIDILKIVKKFD